MPGTAQISSRLALRRASTLLKCVSSARRRLSPTPGMVSSALATEWRPRSWRWWVTGEAVGLVAQALDHVQRRAGAVEQQAFFAVRQHDLLNALGEAEHGDVKAEGVHGVLRRGELAAAAVDEG